jgi:hypothetical protein
MTVDKMEILPPNGDSGEHQWRGITLTGKIIELGKSDILDSIYDCLLIDCLIRTYRSARGISFCECTLVSCTFEAKKELRNLRFTDLKMQDCTFLGRYVGCRFGNEDEDGDAEVSGCDFSKAKLFDLCDFLEGADVSTMTLPAWPHITVTNLESNRDRWISLVLPESLQSIQRVVGDPDGIATSVSIYLPAHCADFENLRAIFEGEDYIR